MIILTGGAGFIGSNFLKKLNDEGYENILIVDSLGRSDKWKNLVGKKYLDYCHKDKFLDDIKSNKIKAASSVFHLGACSDTMEMNADYLMQNNFHYSKELWKWAKRNNTKFMYASSAATYGDGSNGYSDSNETTMNLKPLNMYGYSKQLFDVYILKNNYDSQVTGLKFFNVFGPNEYHKCNMRSKVYKAFHEVMKTEKIKLFKSSDPEIKDGEQKRDFIYIKDCVEIMWWLFNNNKYGIYNIGSGVANTWINLANAVFQAMNRQPNIEFIEMPQELKGKYQNYTKGDISKLRQIGYHKDFYTIFEAVSDYVKYYLSKDNCFN